MTGQRNIEEQAATWLVRREEPTWSSSDEAALENWLGESDYHKVAFWRLEHGWRQADRVACIGASSPSPSRLNAPGNWRLWGGIAALAASIALLFNFVPMPQLELPFSPSQEITTAQFATDIGRRKTVNFADGSQIELNTATAIRASLREGERVVWLDRGEAFFNVASRPGSEFLVHAGRDTITVVGTEFSVRRNGAALAVAVLEGRVRIDVPGSDGRARSALVSEGDLARTDGDTIVLESAAMSAVETRLAWRTGMLVFEDVPLEEAAKEFNRYNRQQLVIVDPASARLRIGGSFRATNVEAFAQLLEDAYGLDVTVSADRIRVSS